MDDLGKLRERLRAFAAERDWQQFHTPKNLVMALVAEAGELVEQFQWLTAEQSETMDAEQCEAVAQEMADVLLYLVMLADRLGIDLLDAAGRKIERNEQRYPAAQVRGSSAKSRL